jgi:hypothetical protein
MAGHSSDPCRTAKTVADRLAKASPEDDNRSGEALATRPNSMPTEINGQNSPHLYW